jgi:hypothetical protein
MATEERKPWVLPVFFGLMMLLFWLVTDLMKPPKGAQATAPVEEGTPPSAQSVSGSAEAGSGTAQAPEAVSSTVR